MSQQPPPAFTGSLSSWITSLRDWLTSLAREMRGPRYVVLQHITSADKPFEDGILAWNKTTQTVVVSKNGAWVNV